MDDVFVSRLKAINSFHEFQWIRQHLQKTNLQNNNQAWDDIVSRRENQEPLAYIFGSWVFRSHEFFVGPGVLIPRPETEEMVDLVLSHQNLFPKKIKVADLGAGSGCLGLGLEFELKKNGFEVTLDLVERSPAAWPWIEKNMVLIKSDAKLCQTDWINYNTQVDLLVSNPPYLNHKDFSEIEKGVSAFEPKSALVPDDVELFDDATGPYRFLLKWAQTHLSPKGYFCFELGLHQATSMLNLATELGFVNCRVVQDMANKPRFLEGFQHG